MRELGVLKGGGVRRDEDHGHGVAAVEHGQQERLEDAVPAMLNPGDLLIVNRSSTACLTDKSGVEFRSEFISRQNTVHRLNFNQAFLLAY